MGSIRQFLKTQALTRLPDSWLRRLKSRHYEHVLRRFNEEGEPDLKVVRQLVVPNMTVIDLGANIGVYTKALSSLTGPNGRVISVEPVTQTFEILSRNVRVFGMTNVTLVNVAVSDKREAVTMAVPNYGSGGANYYQAQVIDGDPDRANVGRRVQVQAMTLDDVAFGTDRVGFVKCDVEGHELKCLRGAESVLSLHRPAWLIEVWGDPDSSRSQAAEVFALLEAHGYTGWFFDGRKLRPRRSGDQSTNYFFLTAGHVATLGKAAPSVLA